MSLANKSGHVTDYNRLLKPKVVNRLRLQRRVMRVLMHLNDEPIVYLNIL